MNALVVYFSLTGNSKLLAESIADATGAAIESLEPVDPLPHIDPDKNSKFLWGGFYAKVGKKPPLKQLEHDIADQEIIFLCSPIWSWTLNPVMRSFLHSHDLSGKKVAICLTSGRGASPKAIKRYKAAIPEKAELLDVIEFKEPKEFDPEGAKQKVGAWAKKLTGMIS